MASENPMVDLGAMRQTFAGVPYNKHVEHVMRSYRGGLRQQGMNLMSGMEKSELQAGEKVIDEYNMCGCQADFWMRSTGDVFWGICERFGQLMTEGGQDASARGKFLMFQLVTLTFAYTAYTQKGLRVFAGIRKGIFFA